MTGDDFKPTDRKRMAPRKSRPTKADRIEWLEAALEQIEQWSRAYPLEIFPEPDLKRARELLEAGGMTLDAISAHAMRHVIEGVGKIARDALEAKS
jgi:hypothetical protein